jgi:transcriptional regulator with XRE-family HTH domain
MTSRSKPMPPGADLLRAWLDRHGLKQNDLAVRVGTTQATISKLIKGSARPGLALAGRIETATRYPDEAARAPVAGVRASAWLTERDRAALAPLKAVAEEVEARARQDVISAVARWAEWMQSERDRLILEIGSETMVVPAMMESLFEHERLIAAAENLIGTRHE